METVVANILIIGVPNEDEVYKHADNMWGHIVEEMTLSCLVPMAMSWMIDSQKER